MTAEVIIPLFSIACYVVLVVIIARHRHLRREVKLFLCYLLVIMLWSFGSFMVHSNFPIRNTLFWNYFLAIWPPFVAMVYFHFVKVFLRKQINPFWLPLGYFCCLVWVIALAKGYIVEEAYFSEGIYHIKFGMGFFILSAIFYSFVGMAVFWLVSEFRKAKDPFIHNRIGYLLVGISIQLLLTASNFAPQVARYPIDQLGNVINAFLIGYAILRYKLLDISLVLRKGFLYAALTGSIVAAYFIIAMVLHSVLHTQSGYTPWLSILLMAILIAALFHPFYQAMQRRLDRFFERKKYDYRQMLRNSSQTIASTINLDELLMWILNDVSLTLGVEKINMLLYDSERQAYCLRRKRGCDHLHVGALYFGIDSPLVKYLIEKNICLTADDIDRFPQFRALWKCEREGLQELDATVLVPLMAQTELIGILVLGSKKSDEPYTSDDIDLLSTLANQAATAVRNAQLYEKSKQAYKELQEAQERLIRSERLKALGEMTSGVAHDFNNILSTILGRAQLSLGAIQKDEQEDGKMKRSLELIEQAALDATGIVRRLQDFARVRTDHDLDVVDLNDVLRSALEMIKPRLDEQRETQDLKNEVVLNLDETGLVEGNASELKESLVNILINAIEAMPQGGKLTVESKLDGDFTVIAISDTGIGMTSEVKQNIFEPFFTTKGLKGSGMGLSIVYGIISRHNGQINVSSQLGKGSTFAIKFPVTTKSKKDVATEFNQRKANNATILIVEDDKGPRDVLYELLSRAGHKVDTAYNGENGLSLFQQKHYDLVMADLGMPDISGLEVASTVKTNNLETKVILVTGWGIQLDTKDLERQGVDSVIAKPFDKENVLATVDRLLGI